MFEKKYNMLRKECICVFERLTEPLVRRSGSFVYPGAWGVSGVCFVLRDDWSWSSFISFQPSCLWGPPDGLQTSWDPLEFSQVWGLSGKPFINTLHCRHWKLPGHFTSRTSSLCAEHFWYLTQDCCISVNPTQKIQRLVLLEDLSAYRAHKSICKCVWMGQTGGKIQKAVKQRKMLLLRERF